MAKESSRTRAIVNMLDMAKKSKDSSFQNLDAPPETKKKPTYKYPRNRGG